MKINNKWFRAAIPALLIHCSIGTVYYWSTFKEAISSKIGVSTFSLGFALSAWVIAGLTGNIASELILNLTNNRYENILILTSILYLIAFIINIKLVSNKKVSN